MLNNHNYYDVDGENKSTYLQETYVEISFHACWSATGKVDRIPSAPAPRGVEVGAVGGALQTPAADEQGPLPAPRLGSGRGTGGGDSERRDTAASSARARET